MGSRPWTNKHKHTEEKRNIEIKRYENVLKVMFCLYIKNMGGGGRLTKASQAVESTRNTPREGEKAHTYTHAHTHFTSASRKNTSGTQRAQVRCDLSTHSKTKDDIWL